MFKLLKGKLGSEAPERWSSQPASNATTCVPARSKSRSSSSERARPSTTRAVLAERHAIVTSDVVYNRAHLYLQEHNLDGWLT
jgi:hypothetical protein